MSDDISDRQLAKKRIGYFLFFLIVLSAIFESAAINLSFGGYAALVMWSPALAAILALKLTGKSERSLPWRWGAWKYNRMGYWLPVAYASIAYLFVWIMGFGGVPNPETISAWAGRYGLEGTGTGTILAVSIFIILTAGFIRSAATALGEEIGWRGFFVWELRKLMPFEGVALASGAVWAVWHWPVLLFGDYNNAAADLWVQIGLFSTFVLSASVIMAYLTFKSGSLWPAVIFHAAHNMYIQSILTPLTVDTGNTAFWIDEFGVAAPAVSVVFAAYFWRKAKAEGL